MKLKMKNELGLVIEVENPDERLKQYFSDRIAEAYNTELVHFLQEVAVTLRKLKPGDKTTIYSKPIEVTLESTVTETDNTPASE